MRCHFHLLRLLKGCSCLCVAGDSLSCPWWVSLCGAVCLKGAALPQATRSWASRLRVLPRPRLTRSAPHCSGSLPAPSAAPSL